MHFNTLLLNYDHGCATITLNRPDKRNAITYELIDELLAALAQVEKSRAHVLIITGAGKAFCSDIDLDNLRAITTHSQEENAKDSETMARLFRTIYEFPKPTIAAVNRPARWPAAVVLRRSAISRWRRPRRDSDTQKCGSDLFRQLCRRS